MPLTFDFPLEKCKSYQGTNPRPADFDVFWDRALAEMNAVPPDVELDWADNLSYVSQGFPVAALDSRGQGGLSEDRSVVSGNTLNGHFIRGLEDALRGDPDKLVFRQDFLDTAELAKIVMEMPDVDADRVGATGGGHGGGLTVAWGGLVPQPKPAAPGDPLLTDDQRG